MSDTNEKNQAQPRPEEYEPHLKPEAIVSDIFKRASAFSGDYKGLQEQSEERVSSLHKLRIRDYRERLDKRWQYGCILLTLLIAQNLLVFGGTFWVVANNLTSRVNILLPVLLPATLAETAYMVKIIITFLFSEIDYRDFPTLPKNPPDPE